VNLRRLEKIVPDVEKFAAPPRISCDGIPV
jgi:hypothetical protein